MKQDIKDLFKDNNVSKSKLPDTHRQEFHEKLKASKPAQKKKLNTSFLFKVAAILVLFMTITFGLYTTTQNSTNTIVDKTPLELQIETVEKQYLVSINTEWQKFLLLSKDEKLIKRYKNRLNDLDKDYHLISQQYKDDANDILIIETLVENLQTRLQLLKDIQKHIKLLNKENKHYENTTI